MQSWKAGKDRWKGTINEPVTRQTENLTQHFIFHLLLLITVPLQNQISLPNTGNGTRSVYDKGNVSKHTKTPKTTKLKSEGKHLRTDTLEKDFFKIKHSSVFFVFPYHSLIGPLKGGLENVER